jgi:hypothetical protein
MPRELAAALVAAPFTVIVAIITAWATLKVHSIRRERQINLLLPRLDVYKTLWSLMDEVSRKFSRTGTEKLEQEECEDIAETLHNWYFTNGNGIFLSPKARDQFVATKTKLLEPSCSITFDALLLDNFSEMRYLMRKDIGAYEDLSVSERLKNAFLERRRKTETEREAAGPIGRRGIGSSVAPPTHRTSVSEEEPDAEASDHRDRWNSKRGREPDQRILGDAWAKIRQRKAEDRRGHDGLPLEAQDPPTHQPDKPDS